MSDQTPSRGLAWIMATANEIATQQATQPPGALPVPDSKSASWAEHQSYAIDTQDDKNQTFEQSLHQTEMELGKLNLGDTTHGGGSNLQHWAHNNAAQLYCLLDRMHPEVAAPIREILATVIPDRPYAEDRSAGSRAGSSQAVDDESKDLASALSMIQGASAAGSQLRTDAEEHRASSSGPDHLSEASYASRNRPARFWTGEDTSIQPEREAAVLALRNEIGPPFPEHLPPPPPISLARSPILSKEEREQLLRELDFILPR